MDRVWQAWRGRRRGCGSCVTRGLRESVPGNIREEWQAKVTGTVGVISSRLNEDGTRTRETLDRVWKAGQRPSEQVLRKPGALEAAELLVERVSPVR